MDPTSPRTGGRPASTTALASVPWPLRVTDVDVAGHVNNAASWQAVEQLLPQSGLDLRRPHRALLDYRHPIDLDDGVELAAHAKGGVLSVALVAHGVVKAVARVERGRVTSGDAA